MFGIAPWRSSKARAFAPNFGLFPRCSDRVVTSLSVLFSAPSVCRMPISYFRQDDAISISGTALGGRKPIKLEVSCASACVTGKL
jgi:hypothetical protein